MNRSNPSARVPDSASSDVAGADVLRAKSRRSSLPSSTIGVIDPLFIRSGRLLPDEHAQCLGQPGLLVLTERKAISDLSIAIQQEEQIRMHDLASVFVAGSGDIEPVKERVDFRRDTVNEMELRRIHAV